MKGLLSIALMAAAIPSSLGHNWTAATESIEVDASGAVTPSATSSDTKPEEVIITLTEKDFVAEYEEVCSYSVDSTLSAQNKPDVIQVRCLPSLFSPKEFAGTGQAQAYFPFPEDGCGPLTRTEIGGVAVVYRGKCPFTDKARYAREAGAQALVVVNTEDGEVTASLGGTEESSIPVVYVSKDVGEELLDGSRKGFLTFSVKYSANWQSETAVITAKKMLQLDATDAKAALGLMYAFQKLELFSLGRKYYPIVAKYGKEKLGEQDMGNALQQLGLSLVQHGHIAEAMTLEGGIDNFDYLNVVGDELYHSGYPKEGTELLRLAKKKDAQAFVKRLALGEAWLKQKNYKKGYRELKSFLAVYSNHIGGRQSLIEGMVDENNLEAIEQYNEFIFQHPQKSHQARISLAKFLGKHKRYDQAVGELQWVLNSGNANAEETEIATKTLEKIRKRIEKEELKKAQEAANPAV